MHEMSIAMNIVEIAESVARQNNARHINLIQVELGTTSGIVPEALEFCFESACKNTLAENARLELLLSKAEVTCPVCSKTQVLTRQIDLCENCGELLVARQQQELRVVSINVD